jgi:hypothetical protein
LAWRRKKIGGPDGPPKVARGVQWGRVETARRMFERRW